MRVAKTRASTTKTASGPTEKAQVTNGSAKGAAQLAMAGEWLESPAPAVPVADTAHAATLPDGAKPANGSAKANGGAKADGGASSGGSGSANGAAKAATYTGSDIQILEGVQHIRHRPGMYIGSTSSSGLNHLIFEAIDNVVDEFNAGFGQQLWLTIDRDGRVTIRDEARGIPFDLKESGGKTLPAATWIFIKPFSGGKFEAGAYKQAGGLHGVGLTVINALSRELVLDIWRNGMHFHQVFRRGEAEPHTVEKCDPKLRGTQYSWLYDDKVFDRDVDYDVETLASRLEATACLNKGLKIELSSWDAEEKQNVKRTFHSKDGLVDFVRRLVDRDEGLLFKQPISIAKARDEIRIEVVLQPDKGYKTRILSFANGVRTSDGGTHETGFRAALTKVVNDYALKLGVIKDRQKDALKPDIIQQGLAAVVSVWLNDPQFQSQTKNRLNNAPVEGATRSAVAEGLSEWFETNADKGKDWIKKLHLAQKARNQALKEEELARAGQKKGGEIIDLAVSKKFAACNSNDPGRCELFIVEGDSAGGSAKQARRSEYQAILALKGKPLNVANASTEKIVGNEEIRTIISVIGTGVRDAFDLERRKFDKVILLADADVDGSHITCLLLTLFYKLMPGLLDAGHVYIGCPPLYSVVYKKKRIWLIDDEAQREFLEEHPDAASAEFKRYKGLGEMNPGELRETTMDPASRVLKKVTIEDAALATESVSNLMGKENAEARRALLAKMAKRLAAAGIEI